MDVTMICMTVKAAKKMVSQLDSIRKGKAM